MFKLIIIFKTLYKVYSAELLQTLSLTSYKNSPNYSHLRLTLHSMNTTDAFGSPHPLVILSFYRPVLSPL